MNTFICSKGRNDKAAKKMKKKKFLKYVLSAYFLTQCASDLLTTDWHYEN